MVPSRLGLPFSANGKDMADDPKELDKLTSRLVNNPHRPCLALPTTAYHQTERGAVLALESTSLIPSTWLIATEHLVQLFIRRHRDPEAPPYKLCRITDAWATVNKGQTPSNVRPAKYHYQSTGQLPWLRHSDHVHES